MEKTMEKAGESKTYVSSLSNIISAGLTEGAMQFRKEHLKNPEKHHFLKSFDFWRLKKEE